uniref:Uncharacterized protein n=1 Tax=Anguilla anguilla TaxID=7936 RepID=A0A0E9VSD6_ANGAN
MLKTCSFLNASLTMMVNFITFCVCDFIHVLYFIQQINLKTLNSLRENFAVSIPKVGIIVALSHL